MSIVSKSSSFSDDIMEEFSQLPPTLLPYLKSTNSTLRNLAVGCMVMICRAFGASSVPSIPAHGPTIINLLLTPLREVLSVAFHEILTIKSCRIPIKLFDDLLQRFPDYLVPIILPVLLNDKATNTNSYLTAESFRLLGEILKRHKSLSSETKRIVGDYSLQILAFISKNMCDENSLNMKVKRVKPIVHCTKEFVNYLKHSLQSTSQTLLEGRLAELPSWCTIDGLNAASQSVSRLLSVQFKVSSLQQIYVPIVTILQEIESSMKSACDELQRNPLSNVIAGENINQKKKKKKETKIVNSFKDINNTNNGIESLISDTIAMELTVAQTPKDISKEELLNEGISYERKGVDKKKRKKKAEQMDV